MKLVIVESPTKAKTIAKFLGSKYKVESSFGHVRDLPKSEMGIDIANNFLPKYVIPTAARKKVSNLKKLAEKADTIILATDEDREGEAIAWHLIQVLNIKDQKLERIAFHEITEGAIKEALAHPRELNQELVDAQQARRILDRLVGYELSPFLWKKVAKGLSAGRVQSVAVRLVVERERERQNFKIEDFWTIEANLKKPGVGDFPATLHKVDNKALGKLDLNSQAMADDILKNLTGATYQVAEVAKTASKKSAPAPFTTSTLQQAANRMLGFSSKQTMAIAQQLYEGVAIAGKDQIGLITYMRTDSLNLSEKFLADAKEYLSKSFGEKYVLKTARHFKTKSKGAQEAHEAIRPTDAFQNPEDLKDSLNNNQYKLYKLIWQRALACQMPDAMADHTTVDIDATPDKKVKTTYQFRATGQTISFDGYLKIYPEKDLDVMLPAVKAKDKLELIDLNSVAHATKPPARYSDAGLVKALEQYGVGRPSTYAPTIATIIDRNYVTRGEDKRLAPTDIAFVVIDLLVAHFPHIVDYQFTAEMEEKLDSVAEGKMEWQPVINDFYQPFHQNLEEKYKEISKDDIVPEETTTEICDKCGAPMIIKTGRYGKFLACSGFPDCKNIKPLPGKEGSKEADEKMKELQEKYKAEVCDKCGQPMIIKNGRFGMFLSCSGYPKCKNIKSLKENAQNTGIKCPKCGEGDIVAKRGRRGQFYACSNYPACKNAYWSKPTGEKCPDCGSLLVSDKNDNVKCSNKECGYEK